MKFFTIFIVVGLLNATMLNAESAKESEFKVKASQETTTQYFDPITKKLVDFEDFFIDQKNCTIDFSFDSSVYANGRQVKLSKMMFWSEDLIIASEDNFAFCQNAKLEMTDESKNIKCDVFFRDDLGKGDDVLGLFGGMSQLLNCDRLVKSELVFDPELSLKNSENASCDPDGILHLSSEDTRSFQNCLKNKFSLKLE